MITKRIFYDLNQFLRKKQQNQKCVYMNND